ncbi:DsbE family thiol:disulfide interchange protein [Asticcacaulis sp. EMRT-3]|uniref:DsbE family thiol:disulfide interchange protein n=1 Tax=Asticcacaulis sp. EMRT-3 TaxID=3040349 RepID=UPI0024AE91C8|nr:DsbE family thiol:disulfide interchange protein [Asticcacaulis sp. EMRT-3]MDI7775430.1 DsbE family thiol:disulfide interchange protein [Asticcacaulis sp. EMRT-3]
MKRLLFSLPLILFVILLAILGWYNFHKKAQYEPRAMVGKSVPAVVLNDVQGGPPSDLKSLLVGRTKPVLVNVFASWCVPCMAENPQLMALKSKGVTIIGVAWKDEPQNTLNFLAQHDDPYIKTLTDPNGDMALGLGISGVPETFIVAPDGTITDKITGPIVPETVDAVFKEVQ